MSDGRLLFESDHVITTPYPSSRFASPVAMAIFVYGIAPEDSESGPTELPRDMQVADAEAELDDDPPPQRTHTQRYAHGIRFVGVTKEQSPLEIRSIVARMHLTYGHPPNRELVHFVAQQGASLPAILTIKALNCDTCLRRQKTQRPRTAKLPDFLQVSQPFDRIQMDVFYQCDCRGNNHVFLGIIDDCSLLHMVGRVGNREALTLWHCFRQLWLVPFGLPLEIICDADGSFFGEFQKRLDDLGISPRYVPAEAH